MEIKMDLLTREEKAKEQGVTVRTIDRWVLQGKINWIFLPNSKRRRFLKEVVHAEDNS